MGRLDLAGDFHSGRVFNPAAPATWPHLRYSRLATSILAGSLILGSYLLVGTGYDWLTPGRGTALQLVGGGALFAAVFPALTTQQNKLISLGALFGKAFVYVGTWVILSEQSITWLRLIMLITVPTTLIVTWLAAIANLFRELLP